MDNSGPYRGNIGEWSELYALTYILGHGGAHAADANQSSIEHVFYQALSASITPIGNGAHGYVIEEHQVHILCGDSELVVVDRTEILEILNVFKQELIAEVKGSRSKGVFNLPSGDKLIRKLRRNALRASSMDQTSDLELVLKDKDNKIGRPKVGFSVKSQMGSASTLLNASGATNFTFKIVSDSPKQKLGELNFEDKSVVAIIDQLSLHGYRLQFHALESDKFRRNLTLIDTQMVENVSKLLLEFYSSKSTKLSEIAKVVFPDHDDSSQQKIFKIKQMLGAIAMGMRPGNAWDGDVTKFKGLILVTKNCDVGIYYLDNLSDFQEFLFESVKFEQPSRSKHKYGSLYEVDGDFFIKLNLQIRFLE